MKQINVRIPDELHRAVKTKAAKEGKTMTEVIVTWLQEWVVEGKQEDEQTESIQAKTPPTPRS